MHVKSRYVLKRDVWKVWLNSSPVVRIQCSVSNDLGSDAIVFDPQDARGLTRYAVLPRSPDHAIVSCTSDRLQDASSDGTAETYFYVLRRTDSITPAPAPTSGGTEPPALVIGCWSSAAKGAKCTNPPDLELRAEALDGDKRDQFLRSLKTINPHSTLRSFDPNTLVLDLMKVLGAIALDRADEGLKHYVRNYITRQLCENLSIADVIDRLSGSPLYEAFKLLPRDEHILHATCSVLGSIRIDELASAKDVLWKALMSDASRLAFRMLSSLELSDQSGSLSAVFEAANSVLVRSLLGDQSGSERDVQAMLLSLDHVGGVSTSSLRCGLEAGIAVLRLCLRDNTCSADELDLLIQQENGGALISSAQGRRSQFRELAQRVIHKHGEHDDTVEPTEKAKVAKKRLSALKELESAIGASAVGCELAYVVNEWPALRPILGKIADVLQPPPGATPAATTANALEIITEIAEPFLDEWLVNKLRLDVAKIKADDDWKVVNNWQALLSTNSYPRTTLSALRKFIAVLRGEDPAMAVAELGNALALAVTAHCDAEGEAKCNVPVKSAQITRAFTVLTAISSYSASYRAAGKDGEVDDAAREEERKKALESVIDAFTDRSHRGGETVWSLGADVGVQVAGMGKASKGNKLPNGETTDYAYNAFAVPMGLALQSLPDPQGKGFGGHVMATFIDPAQYATTSNWSPDAKFVRASPATAVRLGLRGGLLLGEPGFPISIVGHVSYSPALEMWTKETSSSDSLTPHTLGVVTYGVSAGIYVPFLDLN